MKTIVRFMLVLVVFGFCVAGVAQNPQTLTKTELSKVDTVKLPAERSTQLKQIIDRQELLAKEFQQLESQKIIIVQRAALELHLTAEQIDAMDLVASSEGYVFKPKEKAAVKPESKKEIKP